MLNKNVLMEWGIRLYRPFFIHGSFLISIKVYFDVCYRILTNEIHEK